MSDSSKKNQLKGRENFLPWLTRLETLLELDEVLSRNEETGKLEIAGLKQVQIDKNEKIAKKYIIQNCSDSVMHSITPNESFEKILAKLNSSYGFGNMDPAIILNQLRDINFHPSKDPAIVLNEIDLRLAELVSAGGSITDGQMVQYIHDGLSGDSLRDNFWFNCRGAMNMKKLSSFTVETAGQYIVQFWYSYKPKTVTEKANYTEEKKGKFEKRFCQTCSDAKRFKIMKTHNTKDCRVKQSVPSNEQQLDSSNKATPNYEPVFYHDSGTTKTMVNFPPPVKDSSKLMIPVFTAGANQPPEIGVSTGKIKFGSLDVDVLEVPTFAKNLLSATQLSRAHGCKQVIDPWTAKLTISKDDEVIATGSYDPTEKLIRIDKEISNSAKIVDDWKTVHRKLGHVGKAMMKKTLQATSGILTDNKFEALDCEECKITKAKRNPISKGRVNLSNPKDILEVVEIDVQGPFPVVANDGTTSNLKFIDSRSSWLHFTTIPNLQASTVLDNFLKFKTRVEKQTGKEIKRVRTDQGTEFMGAFLTHLETSGIIKEKGVAYTHHHPGKVERSHQTVLRLARAMLKESLLPPKFYDEAQRTAAYLFNRTVHGNATITPFEMIFNRKPDLSHLRPFGTVCYAFLAPEKRNKLDDSAIKCRLIGYGDDFELEEMKAYKLLKEDDCTIIWSDNCIFDKDLKMERLSEIFYAENDDKLSDSLWKPFDDEELDKTEEGEDIFFDADEALDYDFDDLVSEEESANLVNHLLSNKWWTESSDPNMDELYSAYRSVVDGTPTTFKEAMESEDKESWKAAMDVEMKNIEQNNTFEIKRLSAGEKAIGCRWVFKKKLKKDGSIDKFKARLVAKGYLQRLGRDYNETFAPVAKFKSIRLVLALAAQNGWKVYHDDVTSAFLNGQLKETVFMDQPDGYDTGVKFEKWKLNKTLYGLKQSPREWNEAIHNFILSEGFSQSQCDPCLYYKRTSDYQVIVDIYVDDVIATGSNDAEVQNFRAKLKSKFKCSEGGLLDWSLGMEVVQHENGISLNQKQYVLQKLDEFNDFLEPNVQRKIPLDPNFQNLLLEASTSNELDADFPYRSVVGSLMFASTGSRPDISAAVGVVSRYLTNPKLIHCNMARQILYYLRRYPDRSLNFSKTTNPKLEGYCDASWANNEDYSSISGFAFMYGPSLVSWSSKKQPVVALSSTEAEYVTVTSAAQESLWFQSLLKELGYDQETVILHEDNEACINLTKNPQEYKRTRHIQVKYHFIRSLVKSNKVKLQYIRTNDQLADIFTKGVNGPRLKELCRRLGLQDNSKHGRELEFDASNCLGWRYHRGCSKRGSTSM